MVRSGYCHCVAATLLLLFISLQPLWNALNRLRWGAEAMFNRQLLNLQSNRFILNGLVVAGSPLATLRAILCLERVAPIFGPVEVARQPVFPQTEYDKSNAQRTQYLCLR